MRLLVITIVAFLSACGPEPSVPNQERAEEVVWRQVYGAVTEPPRVSWVFPEALDCDDRSGFIAYDQLCVHGVYSTEADVARVAYRSTKLYRTSYAHELLHALLYRTLGTPTRHDTPEWQPGGLLEAANAALAREDL